MHVEKTQAERGAREQRIGNAGHRAILSAQENGDAGKVEDKGQNHTYGYSAKIHRWRQDGHTDRAIDCPHEL